MNRCVYTAPYGKGGNADLTKSLGFYGTWVFFLIFDQYNNVDDHHGYSICSDFSHIEISEARLTKSR